MDMELEGGKVKPLTYKIKAMSRETSAQKAIHVLDADLRNYWSTGTNTKEWILLELNVYLLLYPFLHLLFFPVNFASILLVFLFVYI